MPERDLDVVVWGATGFTGRLTAEYLWREYGAGGDLRWALGGRNPDKLAAVAAELGITGVETVVANADDPASLDAMTERTRVVATTVGPYARYGGPLVASCVKSGTAYCDLTGEVAWMRRMIDAHDAQARETGARIVHTCGFDSIPSDLGVYLVQRELMDRTGRHANVVKYRVLGASGGFSGGTVESMFNMLDEADADPTIRDLLDDPYALSPDDSGQGLDGPDRMAPAWDPDFNAWTGPFVMGPVNTRVVRRSNALLDYRYGRDLRYDEATLMPGGPAGVAAATGLSLASGGFMAAAAWPVTRQWLRRALPEPGEGPSAQQRESGYFNVAILGYNDAAPQQRVRVMVKGDADPGYGSTSKMLAESAVCLALTPSNAGGGVQTPAAAMGDALLERLSDRAGVTFDVEFEDRSSRRGFGG